MNIRLYLVLWYQCWYNVVGTLYASVFLYQFVTIEWYCQSAIMSAIVHFIEVTPQYYYVAVYSCCLCCFTGILLIWYDYPQMATSHYLFARLWSGDPWGGLWFIKHEPVYIESILQHFTVQFIGVFHPLIQGYYNGFKIIMIVIMIVMQNPSHF